MDVEVRPLIVTDVFTVARMLSKVTKGVRAEIAKAVKAEGKPDDMPQGKWDKLSPEEQSKAKKKPDPTELGIAIFQSMFVEAEEDLLAWLASLIDKTKEEFGAMPATTVIDIIEKLSTQEDIKDFFARVSQLASLTSLAENPA